MADPALALITLAYHVQTTKMAQIAAYVLILYEYGITFGDEVNFMWKKEWTWPKLLYLWNRYLGICFLILDFYAFINPGTSNEWYAARLRRNVFLCSTGLRWLKIQGIHFISSVAIHGLIEFMPIAWSMLVGLLTVEVVLQFRIWAMYACSRRILGTMAICFLLEIVALCTGLSRGFRNLTVTATLAPRAHLCTPVTPRGGYFAYWVPPLIFESILLALSLRKAYDHYREYQRSKHWVGGRALRLIIRDSVWYFVGILLAYFANVLVWILVPVSLIQVPIGFSKAIPWILSNRMIINVRMYNDKRSRSTRSSTATTFGVLESEMDASKRRLYGGDDLKENSKWREHFDVHFDSFELRDISSPLVDFRTVAFNAGGSAIKSSASFWDAAQE